MVTNHNHNWSRTKYTLHKSIKKCICAFFVIENANKNHKCIIQVYEVMKLLKSNATKNKINTNAFNPMAIIIDIFFFALWTNNQTNKNWSALYNEIAVKRREKCQTKPKSTWKCAQTSCTYFMFTANYQKSILSRMKI